MTFSGVLSNVSKHISLTETESAYFTSLLTRLSIKKKEHLLHEGAPCITFNYVEQGALRAYHRDANGTDSIVMFALPDWWVTDMHSFISQRPAMLNIDALEDSTIWQLKKNDMDALLTKLPKFERFFRVLMQNAYIRE